MRAMFTMMNDARLEVGLQGLAVAETAYQSAVAYASERLQGRALPGAKEPERPADPIIVHPDVRRMLLTMRATTEGARALAYWVGMHVDLAKRHPDAPTRQAADDLLALMTPIVKAYLTDQGSAAANLGVQVMGGHGYIREWGMEQLVRDARITQLYEGANGIQALDLVGRKLPAHYGRYLRTFFHPVMAFIERHQSRSRARRVRPAARQGVRAPAAGHAAPRPGGPQEPGRGGRRVRRLPPPVRAGGAGVHVGADGPGRPGEARRRRRWRGRVLRGQDPHRALLHDQAPARERRLVRPDHGGRRAGDGVRGRRLLADAVVAPSRARLGPPPACAAAPARPPGAVTRGGLGLPSFARQRASAALVLRERRAGASPCASRSASFSCLRAAARPRRSRAAGSYHYRIRHALFGDIGAHEVTVGREAGRLVIEHEAHLMVELLGVTAHERRSRYREVWQDDRLVAFDGLTVDNAERFAVSARAEGERLVIEGAAGRIEAPAATVPSQPSRMLAARARCFFDIKTGELLHATVRGRRRRVRQARRRPGRDRAGSRSRASSSTSSGTTRPACSPNGASVARAPRSRWSGSPDLGRIRSRLQTSRGRRARAIGADALAQMGVVGLPERAAASS